MTTTRIPADYGAVSPYVCVRGAAEFVDFMVAAFGAVERGRFTLPDGRLGHAEVLIGDRVVMAFDAAPQWPDCIALLSLYVEDVDATFDAALTAGAKVVTPLADDAFGSRGGRVRDPFGNIWWLASHLEDLTPEEMERRLAEPAYQQQMATAMETFDAEMRSRVG
ncbi:VOC family protein [Mumia quercus]|uniref:VOC family protein n=1 Tax=Mumia quercus TaxID=2976125 RepID=UPI0021CFD325|nr:VOC family protein [Mumia quercus]